MAGEIEQFRIDIADADICDLEDRLARTRWPREIGDNTEWQAGTNLTYMRELAAYWQGEFDWRAQEAAMNAWPHFRTDIDGFPIHFIHVKGAGPAPMPLILNHGWPWTFWDFRKVIGPLTDPAAYGGDPADAFDLVIPSLPGFAFSGPLSQPDVTPPAIADLWAKLMHQLGYARFAVQGSDVGDYVATFLGHRHPDRVAGIHLQHVIPVRGPFPTDEDYAPDEQWAIATRDRFAVSGMGYFNLQSTKPQTIAYAMTDSPVGLAAWLIEKRRDWAGTNGDIESVFSKDDLLTTVCLYWFTETYRSAAQHYHAPRVPGRIKPFVHDRIPVVEVPVAALQFGQDITFRPRAWAERMLNIKRWTVAERGGHFGAFERPELLVNDLREFFRTLR